MELSKFFEGNVTLLFDRIQDRINNKSSHSTPNSPVKHFACLVTGQTSPRPIARQVPEASQGSPLSGNGPHFFRQARTTPNSPVRSSCRSRPGTGSRNGSVRPRDKSFQDYKVQTGKKKEDSKDGMRQRSWTTDSEASWASKSFDKHKV
ncbi:hypothetical protein Btru_065974 [Bulinus truncatus]|nr:hypothetical protein Btru_065974 [Bulinus truncatus]